MAPDYHLRLRRLPRKAPPFRAETSNQLFRAAGRLSLPAARREEIGKLGRKGGAFPHSRARQSRMEYERFPLTWTALAKLLPPTTPDTKSQTIGSGRRRRLSCPLPTAFCFLNPDPGS